MQKTNIKKLLRQWQGLIISCVAILIGVAGLVFGILPLGQRLLALNDEVETLKNDVVGLSEKVAVLDSLDETSLTQTLEQLLTAVPSDKSLGSLFATVDGLAAESGVALADLTIANPGSLASDSAKRQSALERQVGSSLLPFSLTVAGTFGQIRDFLETVVAVRRFFRVRTFDLSFVVGDRVSTQMTMDAFYSPFPTNLGSADQKLVLLTEKEQERINEVIRLPLLGQDVTVGSVPSSLAPSVEAPRDNPFSL